MHETTLYRLEYEAPSFLIDSVDLTFELDPKKTLITARYTLTKNPDNPSRDFILDGSDTLTLESFIQNGETLDLKALTFNQEGGILLTDLPDTVTLEIQNSVSPLNNHRLQGIFMTDGLFCSDCEPQGFRHITYFPDRPDVMATYRVKVIADKAYPVLLSNGNLLEEGKYDETRHYTIWHDPFPKPTYLFALVAGDLEFIEATHIRPDGSPVKLRIYAHKPFIAQCEFALGALKRAMQWDEERFGLVCDLDHYNIVAVNDFNGGAMENKGLNIFNAKFILADPNTATDEDFKTVEAVIGHEYFHNWTGNRITCRDWFNLSLKEGLTVFREQEFTADLHHRGIKRIEDVALLRTHQFAEDAGPLSHPVRPDECEKVENFYTMTIYEKGAEVIRLYQTILGHDGFNKGLKKYIEEFDGQAVTTDEFLYAMESANETHLTNFDRWYSQSGTPELHASIDFHPESETLRLALRQVLPDSKHQKNRAAQPIPIKYALFSQDGEMLLEEMLIFNENVQCVLFHGIKEKPVISLLRDFSAPVKLHFDYTLKELILILHAETDDFARWEAMQRIYELIIFEHSTTEDKARELFEVFEPLFANVRQSPEFYALLFTLPTVTALLPKMESADPLLLFGQINGITRQLAAHFEDRWLDLYEEFDGDSPAHRAIKNCALSYLAHIETNHPILEAHYMNATNMTDRKAAFTLAIEHDIAVKETLLTHFLETYRDYPTVIDSWFALQARSPNVSLPVVKKLTEHPQFSYKNPNRARSVIAGYGMNVVAMQRDMPASYAFHVGEIVKVDGINPQTAARLIGPYTRIGNYSNEDQAAILAPLNTLLESDTPLSNNLHEQIKRII